MAERVRPPLLVAPDGPTGPLVATGVRGPGGVLPGSVSYDGSVSRGGLGPRAAASPARGFLSSVRDIAAPARRAPTRSTDLTVLRAAARGAAGRERVNAFRAHHFTALGCRPADSTR